MSQEFLDFMYQQNPYYWTQKERLLKSKPWSFEKRAYLKDVYNCKKQHMIISKGRQVELSEAAANNAINYSIYNSHRTTLYTLPSDRLCTDFFKLRVEPILQQPNIRRHLGDSEGAGLVKFKNGSALVFKTASNSGDKARSISADKLICDEYQDFDRISSDVDKKARDVLLENVSHSDHGSSVTFGTPKTIGSDFHELWESSTQDRWQVICKKCDRDQPITFRNIMMFDEAWDQNKPDLAYYGCVNCSTEIEDRNIGRWVQTNPHGILKGFHIPRLIVPWHEASNIVTAHGTRNLKGKTTELFYNEVLGEFYSGSSQPFNDEILNMAYNVDHTFYESYNGSTFMGIDWGDTTTVCVIDYDKESDIPKIVHAAKFSQKDALEQVDSIAELIRRFNVRFTVADFGYGKVQNYELKKKFPGRVYEGLHVYNSRQTEGLFFWNHSEGRVNIERDKAISELSNRVKRGWSCSGGLLIPRDHVARYALAEYLEELKNVIAVQKNNRTTYERVKGGDHFMHALLYSIIATQCEYASYAGKTEIITTTLKTSLNNRRLPRRR